MYRIHKENILIIVFGKGQLFEFIFSCCVVSKYLELFSLKLSIKIFTCRCDWWVNFFIKSSYCLFYFTILCDIYERILALRDLLKIFYSAFRNFIWSCRIFYWSILFLYYWFYFSFLRTYYNLLWDNEVTEEVLLFDLTDI